MNPRILIITTSIATLAHSGLNEALSVELQPGYSVDTNLNPDELKPVKPKPDNTTNLSMQGVSRASKIMDSDVKDPNGEHLGRIVDLVLNPESGAVAYAVLAFGSFWSKDDKLFAIPLQSLNWISKSGYYALNLDKAILDSAPGFDQSHWPDGTNYEEFQSAAKAQFYGIAE